MKAVLLAAILAAVPAAGFAQTFELTIKNGYTDVLSGLSIAGGKVVAFKPVPAAATRKFDVTLPDGKCEATITGTFSNGQRLDAGKFDFCKNDLLNIWFS